MTIKRPSMLNTLVDIAWLMGKRSTCILANVGALATRDDRVLATGYNGVPAGMPHCVHPEDERNSGYAAYHDPSKPKCLQTVHAEGNVLAFAAKHGIALGGATIITTLSPCYTCAGLLINAGISKVYCVHKYRDPAGIDLLRDATVDVVML